MFNKAELVVFVFIIAAALQVCAVGSTLDRLLPDSSHYQGYTYYDATVDANDGSSALMRGRIDFAVYDTLSGNEWANAGFENPGNGRYVYAYQMFNDYDGNSEVAIEKFTILNFNEEPILISEASVKSVEDYMGGQEPFHTELSNMEAVWSFSDDSNNYVLDVNEHSWFLVFSSNYNWETGAYQLDVYGSDSSAMYQIVVPGGYNSNLVYDRRINFSDFSALACNWLMSDCNELNDWCQWSDIDRSGGVDFDDLVIMADRWLERIGTQVYEAAAMLPVSSHYCGSAYYNERRGNYYMMGRIDFAVYDTMDGNEWANAGFENPGDGRYVYAYQIFNDYEDSDIDVEAFTIIGVNAEPLEIVEDSMTSFEDPLIGQDCSSTLLTAITATWYFSDGSVANKIAVGEHSYFLLLSSDSDWGTGTCLPKLADFRVIDEGEAEEGDIPVPGDEGGGTNEENGEDVGDVEVVSVGSLSSFSYTVPVPGGERASNESNNSGGTYGYYGEALTPAEND